MNRKKNGNIINWYNTFGKRHCQMLLLAAAVIFFFVFGGAHTYTQRLWYESERVYHSIYHLLQHFWYIFIRYSNFVTNFVVVVIAFLVLFAIEDLGRAFIVLFVYHWLQLKLINWFIKIIPFGVVKREKKIDIVVVVTTATFDFILGFKWSY